MSQFQKKIEAKIDGAVAKEAPQKTSAAASEISEYEQPKSRKELRAERKASKKALICSDKTTELTKERKITLRKEKRKAMKKEQRLKALKEEREYKKRLKEKRLRRESNAPGGISASESTKSKRKQKQHSRIESDEQQKPSPQNTEMNVFNALFNGSQCDTTGTTTLRMGVKYIDVVVGKGRVAEDRMLVNVSYKLKGGKYGAVIDSSKNFSFRIGKGEVIQGWEIGVIGMREGGRRHLIVPPKAGYGSEDIGAGPGATLFFDISLLSLR